MVGCVVYNAQYIYIIRHWLFIMKYIHDIQPQFLFIYFLYIMNRMCNSIVYVCTCAMNEYALQHQHSNDNIGLACIWTERCIFCHYLIITRYKMIYFPFIWRIIQMFWRQATKDFNAMYNEKPTNVIKQSKVLLH